MPCLPPYLIHATNNAKCQPRLEYLKAVARGAVDALSLLHQAGVVHGYVSPSTLLVSTPGA